MFEHSFKQKPWGGLEHLQPAPQDTQPGGGEPGTLVSTSKPVAEPEYHNPDPLVPLLGHTNEAAVVVEGGGDNNISGYWVPNLYPH